MAVNVSGVPNSRKTPGIYGQVILGGPGTNAGAAPINALIVGNMIAHATTIAVASNGASLPQATINVASTGGFPAAGTLLIATTVGNESVTYTGITSTTFTGAAGGTGTMATGGVVQLSAITGAAPTFACAAGTYRATTGGTYEAPVKLTDQDDAKTKFGQGSELHLMAVAYFVQDPSGSLTALPIAESGGVRASATLTLVGTASSSGTLRMVLLGVPIDVAITNGDTVTVQATALATAISIANADLPVVAQYAAGVLTVTAKQAGLRGNDIPFRASWVNGTNEIPIGTSTLQFGTTATITGSGHLAGGTTADSATNGIVAIANQAYGRIALAFNDTPNINLFGSDLATKAGPLLMQWGQAIAATIVSPTAAVALNTNLTTGINNPRVQLACLENAENTTGQIAAQVMAARIAGDSVVTSNALPGENTDLAANLNGMQLKTIRVQAVSTDRPTANEIEIMLNGGITPLEPNYESPGFVKVTASITTKCMDSVGALTFAVYKTKIVTVSDGVCDYIVKDFRSTYKGYKLKADAADGTQNKIPRVVTPSQALSRALMHLRFFEAGGVIADVDQFLPLMAANVNAFNPNRMDMDIPEFPIPDCDIIAFNMRQVAA